MRIVFVCTGNICRSPLAEQLCRRALGERGLSGIEVTSCGLAASPGMKATEGAVRAGSASGVDLSAHRARGFDRLILLRDDLVLVMEEWQRRQVVALGSGRSELEAGAVRLLGRFAPGRGGAGDEVADPMGGSDEVYRIAAEHIRACVEGLVAWIEDQRSARA